jgi:hypothetical protein
MTFHEHGPVDTSAQSCCAAEMTLVRIDPKVSSFPELRTFRCDLCGEVRTVEAGPSVTK